MSCVDWCVSEFELEWHAGSRKGLPGVFCSTSTAGMQVTVLVSDSRSKLQVQGSSASVAVLPTQRDDLVSSAVSVKFTSLLVLLLLVVSLSCTAAMPAEGQ